VTKRLDKDHVDKWYDYDVDVPGRALWIGSLVGDDGEESGTDATMAELAVKGLWLLERAAPSGDSPITVYMSNPGGHIADGMAVYDAIRACKNHVTIVGIGKVWSMGAIILQAADRRVLAPNCSVMFHVGTEAYGENHPEAIERWVAFDRAQRARVDGLLLARLQAKDPKLTKAKFDRMNLFDCVLTAQEAIDLGLADELLANSLANP